MQPIVDFLQSLPPAGVLAVLGGIAYTENIFPRRRATSSSYSAARSSGSAQVGFIPALLVSTLGSVLGFLTAFWAGRAFGEKLLERGKITFLPVEAVHKVEEWFRRYGYVIIIVNRFLWARAQSFHSSRA